MKINLFAILVMLLLSHCTLTKRKYMNGWHFEKIHKKNNAVATSASPVTNSRNNPSLKPATIGLTHTYQSVNKDTLQQAKSKLVYLKKENIPEVAIAPSLQKEVLNKISAINRHLKNKSFQKSPQSSKNDFHIFLTYLVFFLGLASFALVIPALALPQGIAGLLFTLGLILLALSITMSASFLQDIREEKSSDITWPYKILITFGAMILSLLITGILLIMHYLIIFDPPLLTIVLSASLCFVVCMIIMLRPLFSD